MDESCPMNSGSWIETGISGLVTRARGNRGAGGYPAQPTNHKQKAGAMISNEKTYGIYDFDIQIRVGKRISRYDSDSLVRFEIKQEQPCEDDEAARAMVRNLVDDALARATAIIGERIDFDHRVKMLTTGDDVESEATNY